MKRKYHLCHPQSLRPTLYFLYSTVHISSQLCVQWPHICSLKASMVRAFIPLKLACLSRTWQSLGRIWNLNRKSSVTSLVLKSNLVILGWIEFSELFFSKCGPWARTATSPGNFQKLFIYLCIWLHQVLVMAGRLFSTYACGLSSCGVQP